MSSYKVPNGNNNAVPHIYKNNDYIIEVYQKCIKIGELEGISYNITREMNPIYENIRKIKLGIAGTLIFKALNKEDVVSNIFNIRIISECNTTCIIGMELIKEGVDINLEDAELNIQYTFRARDIIPWFNQSDKK